MVHIEVVKKENAKLSLVCWTKIPPHTHKTKIKIKIILAGPYLGKLLEFPKKYMQHSHQIVKGVIKFYEMWLYERDLSVIRNVCPWSNIS